MMREVKFRAWDGKRSKFLYLDNGDFEIAYTGAYEVLEYGGERYISGDLEQYTGLKDKNGKEIYEGDIIRAIDTKTHDYEDESEDTVEYIGTCFCLSETWESLDLFGEKNIEVIGNIHETPALL